MLIAYMAGLKYMPLSGRNAIGLLYFTLYCLPLLNIGSRADETMHAATTPMLERWWQCFSSMQKILIVIILIVGLESCHQLKPKDEPKNLDFGAFTIQTPGGWKKITQKGTDSFVGKIAIDKKDTLDFDLGWYSNKLYEQELTILDSSMIGSINTTAVDLNTIVFVKDRRLIDTDKYRKNNVTWDTIDERKAKIVYPRKSGVGITGVYFDSLWISGAEVDRFNLYGENLSPDNERQVLKSLQTLRFRKQ